MKHIWISCFVSGRTLHRYRKIILKYQIDEYDLSLRFFWADDSLYLQNLYNRNSLNHVYVKQNHINVYHINKFKHMNWKWWTYEQVSRGIVPSGTSGSLDVVPHSWEGHHIFGFYFSFPFHTMCCMTTIFPKCRGECWSLNRLIW